MSIAQRLGAVRDRVARAAVEVGRAPGDVTMIAVSKRQPIHKVLEAYDLGVRDFGENTAQGLKEKAQAFEQAGKDAVRWHFIGQLQTNKVKAVLPHSYRVHSVDRRSLAREIEKRAPEQGVDVLIQVNLAGEGQKGGVAPDDALDFAAEVNRSPALRVRGLMTVPPARCDARPYFAELADLLVRLSDGDYGVDANELSMGMSGDFETAIACGATHVRIGSAIFGEREP